jgi:hypothetical protein
LKFLITVVLYDVKPRLNLHSWTKVLIKSIDILGKYNEITSNRSPPPHSPTQCCLDFPPLLNEVQQHCVERGGDVLDKLQELNYNLNSHRGKLKFY